MSTVVQPGPTRRWSYPDDDRVTRRRSRAVSAADEKRYAAHPASTHLAQFLRNRAALVGGARHPRDVPDGAVRRTSWRRTTPTKRYDSAIYVPPQPVYLVDDGKFYPHVLGLTTKVDRETLRRTYEPDPYTKIPIKFFVKGEPYNLFGFIPTERTCSASTARSGASSSWGPIVRGATSSHDWSSAARSR